MWKARKGWKLLAPDRARMPEPLIIWCALMHGLVLCGQRVMTVFWRWLSRHACVRPRSSSRALGMPRGRAKAARTGGCWCTFRSARRRSRQESSTSA
eukprot:6776342-Pyramimonas_sp.AAC.1